MLCPLIYCTIILNNIKKHIIMKKALFLLSLLTLSIFTYAQTWTAGARKLYNNPLNTWIGVGISTPTELFHVYGGAFKIGNSTSATDRQTNLLKFGDGSYVYIGEFEGDDILSFKASKYSFTNGHVRIARNLEVAEKVGVGTSAPLQALHVVDGNLLISRSSSKSSASSTNPNPLKGEFDISPIDGIRAPGCPNGSIRFGAISTTNCPEGVWSIEYLDPQTTSFPGLNFWKVWSACESNYFNYALFLANNGNVGIGTDNPQEKLAVSGKIGSKGLFVNHTATIDWDFAAHIMVNRDLTKAFTITHSSRGEVFRVYGNGIVNAKKIYAEAFEIHSNALNIYWYDHVFAQDYKLRSLSEVEQFIKTNHHLPEIPSEKEVNENGINLGEMQGKLLMKIEELTLYIIEQEKQLKELQNRISELEDKKGGK